MLSGPHQKFCEGIVSGLTRTAAYVAAFPHASRETAQNAGGRLFRKPRIQAEIARLRSKAEEIGGSAILSHLERRRVLARIVRSTMDDEDADLGRTRNAKAAFKTIKTRDKILAIMADAKLAPPPPEAEQDPERAAFHEMIRRIRSTPWRREDAIEQGQRAQEAATRGLRA